MPKIAVNTESGRPVELFYEDYGQGQPIVLIHGWPLTHRAWEPQIPALIEAGYRVIAYDRRGFGQSDKPWSGYDYDTLAADLKGLIDALALKNAVIAGFSMGGGEVARYIGTHGSDRLAGAMLIAAVTPFMLHTEDNPQGVDASIFTGMKEAVAQDRFGFIAQWRENFTNYDVFQDRLSPQQLEFLWLQSSYALPQAMLGCIDAFGSTDFRDDLARCDIPLLVAHGGDDRICPASVCASRVPEYAPNARLEIIPDAPHGLNMTHNDTVNELMLDFLRGL